MRISMIPRYDRNAASSRLRVFAIGKQLERMGHTIAIGGPLAGSDVFFFQKTDSVNRLPAIYDFDDDWPRNILQDAAASGAAFTTDTEYHALQVALANKVYIFPDPIDYEPIEPLPAADPKSLAWFGNYPCFESVRELFEGLNVPRVVITDRNLSQYAFHLPWRYREFPATLRTCGTAFLSHANMDPGKSNNKLTAAVTLGVPVIIGRGSPSYEALAHEAGLDWAIVSTPEELAAVWYRLQFADVRADYLKRIQPLVWERYRVEVVADRFLEIVRSVL